MNQLGSKYWRALKPDAQAFDKILISTAPRWKESELSGDEWRISGKVQFFRKGALIHEISYGQNVEGAIMGLGGLFHSACDNGHAHYAGDGLKCDQEGCEADATVALRLKYEYSRDGTKKEIPFDRIQYRLFCSRHKMRGDCGLEDADANYTEFPMEQIS